MVEMTTITTTISTIETGGTIVLSSRARRKPTDVGVLDNFFPTS